MMLEPSLLWEDALCYHDETLEMYPEIHNHIGVENCTSSAKKTGECKNAFKMNFSKELVDNYAGTVGRLNKHGDYY